VFCHFLSVVTVTFPFFKTIVAVSFLDLRVYSIEKINAITTQPQRNRNATFLSIFALFKNVAHSLEPDETPSSHQAPNYVQRSEKMMK